MSGARPRADLIVSWQGHRVRCWSVGVVKICWQHWENCGRNLRIEMRWTERGQWAVIIVVVYATLLPTLDHLKCVISFSLCKNQRLSNGGRTYAIDRSFYTISDKKRAFPPHSWESTHLYNLPTLESWIQTLCNMVSACSGLDIELYHWSCCIPIFGGCITMVLGCINVITLGIIFVQSYGGFFGFAVGILQASGCVMRPWNGYINGSG